MAIHVFSRRLSGFGTRGADGNGEPKRFSRRDAESAEAKAAHWGHLAQPWTSGIPGFRVSVFRRWESHGCWATRLREIGRCG